MIQATNIRKTFGKRKAIDNINFDVRKGEIFGLVGPDGAGKTTLMRIICNLLTPDSGEVFVMGIAARERERKKEASNYGYMPQRFSLYGDLTVMENLIFFGSMYQLKKEVIRERSEEILTLTNLIQFKDRYADNLSGGMKQKLALTCALVTRPKLLILDEPTYGVDPESRKEFWKILYKLNADGMTIVVSTPYMDEAELCTRVAFINEGVFTAVDTPVRLKSTFPYQVWEFLSEDADLELFSREDAILDASFYGDKIRLIIDPDIDGRAFIEGKLFTVDLIPYDLQRLTPTMEDVFVMMAGGN
jgi:ABC-2 type transport system ATP-binding protein